jgi:hypothetical protein
MVSPDFSAIGADRLPVPIMEPGRSGRVQKNVYN